MGSSTRSDMELAIQEVVDKLPPQYRDLARQTFAQHGFQISESSSVAGLANANKGSHDEKNVCMTKAFFQNIRTGSSSHSTNMLHGVPDQDGNLGDSGVQRRSFFFEAQKLYEENQRLRNELKQLIERDNSNKQKIRILEYRIQELETQVHQSLYATIVASLPLRDYQPNVRADHVVIGIE